MYKHILHILFFLILPLGLVLANDANEAYEAYENGDFERAEEIYRSLLAEDPDDYKLYFNLANAQAKQGNIEEAIQSYMEFKSRTNNPVEKALAEYNIGHMLGSNEQWKPAVNHFKNALKLNPDDGDARYNYELALRKSENEQEQEQQQEQDQNQTPPEPSEYAKAMKKEAEKLVNQRRYREAYDLMQTALAADETVAAFNNFIERISQVREIDQVNGNN